jgi:hypothetical protein
LCVAQSLSPKMLWMKYRAIITVAIIATTNVTMMLSSIRFVGLILSALGFCVNTLET